MHSQRFQDSTPHEIYASLLDEGRFLCSISTMYRILREEDESRLTDSHNPNHLHKLLYRPSSVGLDLEICIKATQLPPNYKDPCDRFIIATALTMSLPVVTTEVHFEE